MAKVKVTKVKSTIEKTARVKATMAALGLNKIGDSNVLETNDAINGMIKKVSHLIKVESL